MVSVAEPLVTASSFARMNSSSFDDRSVDVETVKPNVQDTRDEFLSLVATPFDSQIYSTSFVSAIAFSAATTMAIMLAFCYLRPHRGDVYEPRATKCHGRPLPPTIHKGPIGWLRTLAQTKEGDLVTLVGLDAVVFLRFTRMMRNIFAAISIIATALLIPVNVSATTTIPIHEISILSRLTPQYVHPGREFWAYVASAYMFDVVVCSFLWINYAAVLRLRREFFRSAEYQDNLHARTLLITGLRSPVALENQVGQLMGVGRGASIGRNVTVLERRKKEYNGLVQKLIKDLTDDPERDRTTEWRDIEKQRSKIEHLMRSPKNLKPLSYGFAVFGTPQMAHSEAYRHREGGPEGTTVHLATEHHNFIWDNLNLSERRRRQQRWTNHLTTALLTVAWIAPNVFIAVFLCNVSHLSLVWPTFRGNLRAHRTAWGIFQGIVPPAITSLFYFYLPTIFRRMASISGDITKTSREHQVTHKLFSFFFFNHLIVISLFSTFWGFGAALLDSHRQHQDGWKSVLEGNPFQKVVLTLITVTPYWCCWLLQRNLITAVDLGQLVRIVWVPLRGWLSRRTARPGPNVAPLQPFDYASYYTYFLFYAAIALCFGPLQPLIFAIACLYFWVDSVAKKYMILYIFATKHESGGLFWRSLFDRMLVNTASGNVIVALLVVAQGTADQKWFMLGALIPLPFLLALFKWHCGRTFDQQMHYYYEGPFKEQKQYRPGEQFVHPALTEPLMIPHWPRSERSSDGVGNR